jgi:hypothetical protein
MPSIGDDALNLAVHKPGPEIRKLRTNDRRYIVVAVGGLALKIGTDICIAPVRDENSTRSMA